MSAPKFEIGQRVRAKVKEYTWEGTVYRRNDAGDSDEDAWEYWVDNNPWTPGPFPLLAWEEELTALT